MRSDNIPGERSASTQKQIEALREQVSSADEAHETGEISEADHRRLTSKLSFKIDRIEGAETPSQGQDKQPEPEL